MNTTIWSEITEPQNYQDVINDPIYGKEWELAIKEEYDSLMKNGMWELAELPPGNNLLTSKWVSKPSIMRMGILSDSRLDWLHEDSPKLRGSGTSKHMRRLPSSPLAALSLHSLH